MSAQVREFNFQERLIMSNGISETEDVREIIVKDIPGAVNVIKAHALNDRRGVDYWVELGSGKMLSVDCKIRDRDYGEDDLALETWSVIEQQKIGWTLDESKMADYIVWFWKDSRRYAVVPFLLLCRVFQERRQQWYNEYKHAQQKTIMGTAVYHSECVFVPRRVVWGAMYNRFSGVLSAVKPHELS